MNLRFKAEVKDVVIFGIFAFCWFLVSMFIVSNISQFLNGETLTMNIFISFMPKNIAATILVFFAGIIAAFVGVKSFFFEREDDRSGIGISIGTKREKNYARWAKEKEIEKGLDVARVLPTAPKATAGGIPLKMNPHEVYVDNGGYHNLVIGSTGSGKTQTSVLPMVNLLAKHDESMIITDPKGEIFEDTSNYLKSLGYNVVLLNFRDPQ